MPRFDRDPLPSDLADLGERLRAARPSAPPDVLDRVAARIGEPDAPRGRFGARRRRSRRSVAAIASGIALTLGVVGTASAVTVSLTGLSGGLITSITTSLHLTTPVATIDTNDPAAAQYLSTPCISALVKLGNAQASATVDPIIILLDQLGVELYCGGSPTANRLTASPTSLNLGTVRRGSASPSQTITFTNTGANTLTVASVTLPLLTADFRVSSDACTGKTLATAATCTVKVQFTPPTLLYFAGAKSSTLTVSGAGFTTPVALTATAT